MCSCCLAFSLCVLLSSLWWIHSVEEAQLQLGGNPILFYHIDVCNRYIWYHINVCKQMMIDKKVYWNIEYVSCQLAHKQDHFLSFFFFFFHLQALKRLWAHRWLFSPQRLLKNLRHCRHTWVLAVIGTVSLCFLRRLTRPTLERHTIFHINYMLELLHFQIAHFSCWCLILLDSNSSTDQ